MKSTHLFLTGLGLAAGLLLGAAARGDSNFPPPEAAASPPPPAEAEPPRTGMPRTGALVGETFSAYENRRDPGPVLAPAKPAGEPGDKPKPWNTSLNLGMNLAKGNSDVLRYYGALEIRRETPQDIYRGKLDGTYGEADRAVDTQNAYLLLRYERNLAEPVYVSADGSLGYDEIADLRYRAIGILSIGRHLVREERALLNAEIGAGYVAARKLEADDRYIAGRLAAYCKFLVNEHVVAWQALEYLPDTGDAQVYLLNAEVGTESLLSQTMSLKLILLDRFDSAPAPGKKNNDLSLMVTLGLRL